MKNLITTVLLTNCFLGLNSLGSFTFAQAPEENVVYFTCNGGASFSGRFSPKEGIFDLPDQPGLVLPRVRDASGARYSDGTTTVWNKGEEAFVQVNGETIMSGCIIDYTHLHH